MSKSVQTENGGNILRTSFADRADLIAYLKREFPAATARCAEVAEMRGGRATAERHLARIDPAPYAATRNSLDGAVTRLSAWLRHGVLTLAEVRRLALRRAGRDAARLISQLGWRDYWQRVYAQIGAGIWQDREAYKTGWQPEEYADQLPDDLLQGRTGLACMDKFVQELYSTGYLHNHARMWLASYVVHHRRVRWQAGAKWFLTHLLDGDPASNNLSWQWVAGTFSARPYYFNRENLERFTGAQYCRRCALAQSGCPFAGSYEQLNRRLFPRAAG